MSSNMGLLLTLTEPPAAMDEEFNAWYDTEHLGERLAIRGFLSARRWVRDCKPGEGKYLATYELTSPGVLDTPDYLARIGNNLSPWSKRCLGKATAFRRWACEQIVPGNRLPDEGAKALFLACGDVPAAHEEEFNRWYDMEHLPLLLQVPGVLGARRFRASTGSPRYIALYDLANEAVPRDPAWQSALETEWAKRIDELTADCEWILTGWREYRPS
jgi:hypothetical protein